MTQNPLLSVTVSVAGRFHAFDLARQLQQRGALRRLITSYPKFKAREWEIPDSKISTILSQELLSRLAGRAPVRESIRRDLALRLMTRYDRVASKRIPDDTQLFVGWSGGSIESLRQARRLGAKTIVERGSAHILVQNRILTEEHKRLALPWAGIHPGFIDRELLEYEEADFIAVASRFVRDTFLQCGVPARKILVIPYGCEVALFRPEPKLDNVFRVIHCGQLSIQKGVHLLIRAFAELNLPDAELCLIGASTPEITGFLNSYSRFRIVVKGPFPQRSLPKYYSQGSVFCLASIQDGFGMVISQALSCGLPVIASANCGGGEIVEEHKAGFVIPAGDVEALKEKILLLYSEPSLREEMATNAVAMRNQGLGWHRYGDQIVKAYAEIVESRGQEIPERRSTLAS